MCGIVGYFGENVGSVISDVLSKLEYRGYDSAGAATYDGSLHVVKDVGPVSNIINKISSLPGFIGIGHTRWATHGEVSIENAHPHVSPSGDVAIVHNGILENYEEIKNKLNVKPVSDTDSEVIAHYLDKFENVEDGIVNAFNEFKGILQWLGYTKELYLVSKGLSLLLLEKEIIL